jgi:hypothetical protein
MEEAAHDRSYWARIVRKSGDIEYRYLRKEEKDLMKLRAAHKRGDVKHVILWGESELEHTKMMLGSLYEQIKSALIMAHIQKENLHHLLEEDTEIGARGMPPERLEQLKGEALAEFDDINATLRRLGSVLIGESERGG